MSAHSARHVPTAMEIALACSAVPDFSPIAELAKVAAWNSPYCGDGHVAGIYLNFWQKQIFNAQITVLLGMEL
jgi:hypothetical protein